MWQNYAAGIAKCAARLPMPTAQFLFHVEHTLINAIVGFLYTQDLPQTITR
jgi:hypothetical protein